MKKNGFTLLELIITVAVLAVLLTLCAVKFFSLLEKSDEGVTKRNILRMRSAIVVYYGDHEGVFPEDDLSSLVPRYIEQILEVRTKGFEKSNRVYTPADIKGNEGKGGWYYINDKKAKDFGSLYVNVNGKDSQGAEWSLY